MPFTAVINQALAAGASVTSTTLTLTAPVSGVDIELSTQFAGPAAEAILLSYQVSIDSGTTWSDPIPTHVSTPSTDATTHVVQSSIGGLQNATSVRFIATNRSQTKALTNITLQAIQF